MTDQTTKKQLTLENIIKEIIKARGKTSKDVANGLSMNEKTFDGILNRTGAIKADLLFRLSDYLGFDLEWLKASLGYLNSDIQLSDSIPRMPEKLRETEKIKLFDFIDSELKLHGDDITYLTDQVYGYYFRNDFYLLDVILPPEEGIYPQYSNRKKHFCCICKADHEMQTSRMSVRPQILTAREMISRTISERMVNK